MGKRDDLIAEATARGLELPERPTIAKLEQLLHAADAAEAPPTPGDDDTPGPAPDLDPDDEAVLAELDGDDGLGVDVTDDDDDELDLDDDDDADDLDDLAPPPAAPQPAPVDPGDLPADVQALLYPDGAGGAVEPVRDDLGAGDGPEPRFELVVHYPAGVGDMHQQAARRALQACIAAGRRPAAAPIVAHDTPAKSARRRIVVHVPLEAGG